MKKKRILLTGDDGYNSAGTRLLIHCLKEDYELFVTGTATQQSGMGGKMSLATGFEWSHTKVDGIPGFRVEGTPIDAAELAANYFGRDAFDLTISGINWGVNMGSAVFSSGTVNAALRAAATQLSPRVVAMSLDLPAEMYIKNHEDDHSLEEYIKYPGELVCPLMDEMWKQDFWGATVLNINFPQFPTREVLMTRGIRDVREIYDYSDCEFDPKGGHFGYTPTRVFNPTLSDEYDVKAVTNGKISITPFVYDLLDAEAFLKLKTRSFSL